MTRLVLVFLAVATWYRPTDYGGAEAMYCGRNPPEGPLAAVDAGLVYTGVVECGDTFMLYYPDHDIFQHVTVWDIGPLSSYYVEDFADLPIVLDLNYESGAWPVALEGLLSARVWIFAHWAPPIIAPPASQAGHANRAEEEYYND